MLLDYLHSHFASDVVTRDSSAVWMATPALDETQLPEWKAPTLRNVVVRQYNSFTRGIVDEYNRAQCDANNSTLMWFDAYALTDFDEARSRPYALAKLTQHAATQLYATADGIHHVGALSKTMLQQLLHLQRIGNNWLVFSIGFVVVIYLYMCMFFLIHCSQMSILNSSLISLFRRTRFLKQCFKMTLQGFC